MANCRKMLMDCCKVYMSYDITIVLSLMPVMQPQTKPLFVHRTVGIVLPYLNFHVYMNYSVCGGFYSSWLNLCPVAMCLQYACLSSQPLDIPGYYHYHCLYDNHAVMAVHQSKKGRQLNLGYSTGRHRQAFQAIFLMHIPCI